jgi:hypothetical protein
MEVSEQLKQLCERASVEQNSKKLIELTDQIFALFEKRELERRTARYGETQ